MKSQKDIGKTMEYEETIKQIENKAFLDKLYGFSYNRCNSSHEAEDLCSDIVLSILLSIRKNPNIGNFNAFSWTVANRVYADYCEKRKKHNEHQIADSYSDDIINIQTNPITEYIESEVETENLRKIKHEIAFLSKIYRDVMVMYYLDEMKTADIATKLNITETAVKQRLFSARNTIKKEVEKMDNNFTLKPIDIAFIGTGNPVGNDPRSKAERVLSKNLVYLCKNAALTPKEISEKLGVPMPFIEDEIEIQCHGENGNYGFLRMLNNSKYISNIIILDVSEYEAANAAYQDILDEFCERLIQYLNKNNDRILNFPFLNKQNDIRFIAWSLISAMIWNLDGAVRDKLKEKYFKDIEILSREFSSVGFAVRENETLNMGFYGCDGIGANNVCGYSKIDFTNIYGERIEKHCGCGHNISTDPQLMLTIRAIGGLDVNALSSDEKEIAAKAIESGYLERKENILYPKILVLSSEQERDFYKLSTDFKSDILDLADKIAEKLSDLIKKIVPPHLLNEYPMFSMAASIRILHNTIEKCIETGILNKPEKTLCAEGAWMIVTK